MKAIKTVLAAAALAAAAQAGAQITLYEHNGYEGRAMTADRRIGDLHSYDFNDSASSAVVRGESWQVCENSRFTGRCVVLEPGRYPTLASMGLNDRITSVRSMSVMNSRWDRDDGRRDYSRRDGERLFTADVTSVRAVMGPSEQRCWVEREQVRGDGNGRNIGGAIVGGLLGGVLGHQIGGGSGRDIATAGGAIAGAALGSNVDRDRGDRSGYRDVQRCSDVQGSQRPAYYDVTYTFRGIEHRVQTTEAPGATIVVNRDGEPRIG